MLLLLLLLLWWHTVTEHVVRPVNHRRRRRCRTDGLWLAPRPTRRWRRFVQIKLAGLVGIHPASSSAVHRRLLLLLDGMTHAVRIVRHAVMLLLLLLLLMVLLLLVTLKEIVIRHLIIRRGELMGLVLLLLLLRGRHGGEVRTRGRLHGGVIVDRTGVTAVPSVRISFAFGHRLINMPAQC